MLEKTLESPLNCQEIQPVHSKGDQSWVFIGRTDVEAETPILWPPDAESWLIWIRPWCWERLRAGGEGDDRGWDGWMASLTRWTWVWVDSGSWWWTGRPGVLWSMGVTKSRTRLSDWTELRQETCLFLPLAWNFSFSLYHKTDVCLLKYLSNHHQQSFTFHFLQFLNLKYYFSLVFILVAKGSLSFLCETPTCASVSRHSKSTVT